MKYVVGTIAEGPDEYKLAVARHEVAMNNHHLDVFKRMLSSSSIYSSPPRMPRFPDRNKFPVPGVVEVAITDAAVEVKVTQGKAPHEVERNDPLEEATLKLPLTEVRELANMLLKAADRHDLVMDQATKIADERDKVSVQLQSKLDEFRQQEKDMVKGLMT